MKITGLLLSVVLGLTAMCGCGSSEASVSAEGETRTITDGADRQVAIPEKVDSIVCSGVGALRYTCYMQAQDLVIGVEDYEQGKDISRGYSIVNGEQFAKLPVIGANGDPYAEEIITADPDVIFLDFNGMELINENYAENPEYYEQLTAVQEGNVYSQISFRSYASNLDMALADAYYAASVLYPEQFADMDIEEKVTEIFETFLGEDISGELKENGYEFKPVTIEE